MLLGVVGKKRHGKGSIAKVLVEEYGFVEHNFADKLREMVGVLNPFVGYWPDTQALITYNEAIELCGYETAKELFPEIVRLLQVFGTEIGRDRIHYDLWVKLWAQTYKERDYRSRDVVVSDVRFLNEVFAVHDVAPLTRPAVFIKVVRPGYVHNAEHDGHTSEQVPEMPWGIKVQEIVASSVEELTEKVHDVMKQYPHVPRLTKGAK